MKPLLKISRAMWLLCAYLKETPPSNSVERWCNIVKIFNGLIQFSKHILLSHFAYLKATIDLLSTLNKLPKVASWLHFVMRQFKACFIQEKKTGNVTKNLCHFVVSYLIWFAKLHIFCRTFHTMLLIRVHSLWPTFIWKSNMT